MAYLLHFLTFSLHTIFKELLKRQFDSTIFVNIWMAYLYMSKMGYSANILHHFPCRILASGLMAWQQRQIVAVTFGFHLGFRDEAERGIVDAVSQASFRMRSVGKHMTQMGIVCRATYQHLIHHNLNTGRGVKVRNRSEHHNIWIVSKNIFPFV